MGLGSTTVQGEFLGSFSIASIEPLLGGELSTAAGTTIELQLDRYSLRSPWLKGKQRSLTTGCEGFAG